MKPKIEKYNGLSSKEINLITRFEYESKEIYTRSDIVSFCGDKTKANYLIRRLLIKKRLIPIVKNVYLFIPMKAPGGKWAGNEYLIAKALTRGANYYIGYSTVFYSYGFTDQVAQMIHIVNEKYSMRKTVCGVRYKLMKVLPDRIYGIGIRKIKNEDVNFASRERALIDVFDSYDVKKAFAILKEQKQKIDIPVFVDYVAHYPVQIIRRRIGYFLEGLGVPKKFLNEIDVGDKGYSLLYDLAPNTGKANKRWRIIVNG